MEHGLKGFPRPLLFMGSDAYFLGRKPAATAQLGVLNLGDGPFDGLSTGTFTGSSAGSYLALNAASGFSGNLIDAQVAGAGRLKLATDGNLFVYPANTGSVGLIIKSPASYSGDYLQCRTSTDGVTAHIASNGKVVGNGLANSQGTTIYGGSGAPGGAGLPTADAAVVIGDYYFRNDAPTDGTQRVYIATSNGPNATWVNALAGLAGVRQIVVYQPSSDITVDSSHQGIPSTTYANWGHLADVAITTVSGSRLLAIHLGTAWNYYTASGNWWRCAIALDGANVQEGNYVDSPLGNPGAYRTPSVVCGYWSSVSAGSHNVNILGSSGGPGGLNPAGGYKSPTSATDSQLTVVVIEFA